MKQFFFSLSFILSMGLIAIAQPTTLPTSWDCDPTTLPATGWTTNLTTYYNVGSLGYYHSSPSSAKFDATGKYATISFTDSPGSVSYYLRGASFAGGTFTIEESVNGSTWTALHTFTTNMPNNDLSTASPFTDTPNPASRYIRFIYTNKSSGNVAVDDISITKAAAGPSADMAVKCGNTSVPVNSQYVIGNATSTVFKVINYGTDSTLHITGNLITGTDASMFGVTGMPANVPPHDSLTFTLNFTASGLDGTKLATLSIQNSDVNKNPYVIDLYAVKGFFATEPTAAATNLTFTNVKSYGYTVTFSAASPAAENYLVLRNIGGPVTDQPVDGSTYLKGQYIGNSQVMYVGAPGSFVPSFIVANTTYGFKVFSFNGPAGFENYQTGSVLAGNATTPHDMIGNYYSTINPNAPTFIADLHTLINPHTALYYNDYDDLMVNVVLYRDTVVGGESKKVVTCQYSGENYVYTDPWAWNYFSREHSFCQSWMPTYNNPNFSTFPEFADYHNLRPVNQNNVNAFRSNLPLGEVINATNVFYNGKYGTDANGHTVYEPREEHKGDAARSMLYMLVCYDGINGNTWRLPTYLSVVYPYGQDISVLLAWHNQDPPDNWEMAHNDYIKQIQGNRNPFIDSINWVNRIDFSNMTLLGIKENASPEIHLNVYPNPVVEDVFVDFSLNNTQPAQIAIFDLTGRSLYSQSCTAQGGYNHVKINTHLPSGVYALKLQTGTNSYNTRLVVY